ncbi:diaminopropionate ammonia-lyase [Acuticoccus sp. I52.16.1]|uniref:diaminopropionate ammonia-lyase n=1 Tax=Acuticoccus sp. I52.16.1 TaxID=2928472 RepID=UPI001FD2F7BA|nr:diaminopropionate ammonia-lyase [Acuticoccus sp. I52.16.1]UOM32594.1 diaminopropionate ammonia-lyase [Acuticoccus sp. I52.16.1]
MPTDDPTRPTGRTLFVPSADRPLALLGQCPAYAPTPLRRMDGLGAEAGAGVLFVKDESTRMGLGSFKALGGAFAVARMICDAAGTEDLAGPRARAVASGMTFITASAGNHGLSVAAGAGRFGARSVIVLAATVPESFAARIRAKGAGILRVDGDYEASVAVARREAERRGWLLLADGSWQGYVDRPALVMEGYTVLAEECRAAFAAIEVWPSHIVLQAGVGGLAAAVATHARLNWQGAPAITVVEPEAAPCLRASVAAGRLTPVSGPHSDMGRLDCKDASLIAFEALRRDADAFVTVGDAAAAEAAADFARHGIRTTPSGAAGLAALKALDLPADARVLLIASEGPED